MARKGKQKHVGKQNSRVSVGSSAHSFELQKIQNAIDKADLITAYQLAKEFTSLHANNPNGWEMLANVEARQQDLKSACRSMAKAIECAKDGGILPELKLAQYELFAGDTHQAISRLRALSTKVPTEKRVWTWLSRAYYVVGQGPEALAANEKAYALDRKDPDTLLWRSRIFDHLKRHSDAYETAKTLKKLKPTQVGVSNHLASLSLREGDYIAAEKHFNDELAISKNAATAYNALIGKHYNPEYTAEELSEIAVQWQETYITEKNISRVITEQRKSKRIRIGLLSNSFRTHPVSQMILPALQQVDKREVELFCYTTSQVEDHLTHEIQKATDHWISVVETTDEQLNQKIRQDSIDILIDMNGGGEGSRFTALAKEPAPLIVKWVGMLIGTTGLKCFDYLLSDSIETPQNVDHLYTEKLIRLPDDYVCYHLPKYIPEVNSLPALSNRFITFGCLNNPAKLSSPLIKEWSALLNDIPNSKLLLRGIQFEREAFCKRIRSRFAEFGINPERLLLEGPAKHQEFIATYQRIDIALDTWPYSGGLTTCEALAMGVPVVTCVGPTFAGRHSATHLANAGLPELVTDNWDDFRKRAKELAADLPSLAVIRAALRTILIESPVCDGERFAQHFTKAMRGIWQRYCEGKAPEALTFNKEGDAWFADEDQPIELVEAEPEPQEAEFEWNLESPITVIDNGALFARHPKFTEWMQTGNFAVITFDPGSLLTKQADELKKIGEWHHYPHATLGDGADGTLYATLDPELTGSLEPLAERQTMEQNDPLRVLSALPISTIALDSIEGLPGVDVLVLDDLNDAMTILNNGYRYLDNIILLIVQVSNKATHKKQANKFEIENWIKENGFRFYRSENLFTYKDNNQKETFFIFQSAEEEALLPKGLKDKLSYCWHQFTGEEKMPNQTDGCHSELMLSDKKSVSLSKEELVGKKFVHIRYPLIYGISLFDDNVRNSAKSLSLEYFTLAEEEGIVREICRATSSDLVFTGHSFYNLSVKSAPYISENRNLFDLFGIVPFSIVDDHAYADFMLSRCKGAPEEIIMGSTSMQLLDEYEAVSVSKKVHKIKVPPKVAEKDIIPFEEKENRAVFLGKLYDNVPANLAILESKINKDTRLSSVEKENIFKMVEGRQVNAFYSPAIHELAVSDLSLLYYDLVDKFFRNLYREKEIRKIVSAFKKHNIPVHVIGGDKSAWSFEGKEYCVFWPKKSYQEAIHFLHNSKYTINLTPSYPDILTGRAIDMMGSNSLCVSDYTPYYEKLKKDLIYFGHDFIASENFSEAKNKDYALNQRVYINSLYGKKTVEEEWESCIAKAYNILERRSNSRSEAVYRDTKNSNKVVSESQLNSIKMLHEREISRLKNRDKIRVVFLAIHRSTWKVDAIFQQMLRDPIFDPIVLVCPDVNKKSDMLTLSELNNTYAYFKGKGYNVFSSWMKNKKQWRSLDSLKPDLLFFTNPYFLTKGEYYDKAFSKYLSCYVPYHYQVSKYKNNQPDYNQLFHNCMWIIFAPHEHSKSISSIVSCNRGANVVVTGYPHAESLIANPALDSKQAWKSQENAKLRIIWAPHQTIDDPEIPYSTFLKYYDYFKRISQETFSYIQWSFKPHPLLKEKLYLHPEWGKEKTDSYYEYWLKGSNTQLDEGDYTDLFMQSDCIIHDCTSFMAEYILLDKPALYLVNNEKNMSSMLTDFGVEAFSACSHAYSELDISSFIKSVIENKNSYAEKREKFIDRNGLQQFGSPSENIVNEIKYRLFNSYSGE